MLDILSSHVCVPYFNCRHSCLNTAREKTVYHMVSL